MAAEVVSGSGVPRERKVLEPIRLRAKVVHGFGRGSKVLGFPTANMEVKWEAETTPEALELHEREVLKFANECDAGIYYAWAQVLGGKDRGVYKVAMSVGWNPTFTDVKHKTIEPWILHDYAEDFYDCELRLIICGFVRPEMKFSFEDLVEAIRQDGEFCKEALDAPEVAALAKDSFFVRSEDAPAELAPTGKLRVALNMRNQLLVSGKTAAGEPEGLAPSMALAFAERIGVPVEFVPYENAAKLADEAALDRWDVAMIGADPDRATHIDFTKPYCQIEATYAVPETSAEQSCAEVDRDGASVVTCTGAAYTLWLDRNFRTAKVEKVEGHDETYERFRSGGFAAVAGLRSKLKKDAAKLPGTRLLEGKFMAVEQAMSTKKGRPAGFAALAAFVEEAKTTGLVLQLMQKYKVEHDLVVP